ncbi:MAG TPA: hypothetical protein DCY13_10715 [Verrucomicrobiales bacterium]|nr:hypothetical protein [Verrucomicrobiales bacterium]
MPIMKITLSFAAALLLSVAGTFGAGPDAHRAVEMRLTEVEMEALTGAYGEAFRHSQNIRMELVMLEEEAGEIRPEAAEREIDKHRRALGALERRLEELREEMHARAERMQELRPGPRPEGAARERRERPEGDEFRREFREREERERVMQGRPREAEAGRDRGGEGRRIPVSEVPGHILEAARKAAPGIEFHSARIRETPRGPVFELGGGDEGREAHVTMSGDGRQMDVRTEHRSRIEHREESREDAR